MPITTYAVANHGVSRAADGAQASRPHASLPHSTGVGGRRSQKDFDPSAALYSVCRIQLYKQAILRTVQSGLVSRCSADGCGTWSKFRRTDFIW